MVRSSVNFADSLLWVGAGGTKLVQQSCLKLNQHFFNLIQILSRIRIKLLSNEHGQDLTQLNPTC